MGGLRRLCKMFGRTTIVDQHGNKTEWVWNYVTDEPMKKEDMTKEMWAASEKKKWEEIKKSINPTQQ